MALKFNPLTGEFDWVIEGTDAMIPELSSDPVSPAAEDVWVLHTSTGGGGTPGKINAFLGLGFPYLGLGTGSPVHTYQLSYRTLEGTTVRRVMS